MRCPAQVDALLTTSKTSNQSALLYYNPGLFVLTGRNRLRGLSDDQMQPHVKAFEETILAAADSFKVQVRSRRESVASSRVRFKHLFLVWRSS